MGLVSLRRGTDLALLNVAFGKWGFRNAGLVGFAFRSPNADFARLNVVQEKRGLEARILFLLDR